jgi:hypothetical protein
LDANLHIHVLANKYATEAIQTLLDKKAALQGSKWRNSIKITVYNIEKYRLEWREFIDSIISPKGAKFNSRVTLGGYYRLLASRVLLLPSNNNNHTSSINNIVYMDSESVENGEVENGVDLSNCAYSGSTYSTAYELDMDALDGGDTYQLCQALNTEYGTSAGSNEVNISSKVKVDRVEQFNHFIANGTVRMGLLSLVGLAGVALIFGAIAKVVRTVKENKVSVDDPLLTKDDYILS